MSTSKTDWTKEPPLNHADLCQRVRFSLDDPPRVPEAERKRHAELHRKEREFLRATMLRVRPSLMPGLHETVASAAGRLLLREEPEVFVKRDPSLNACALPTLRVNPPPSC